MIWQLCLLWACLGGLVLLFVAGGTRFADDEFRPVAEFAAEQEGLGRCVRRAQQIETGPGCTRGSVRTSTPVSRRAARRS